MMQNRTVVRWFAALAVAGGLAFGAVAPASAATTHTTHFVQPTDTGWNGT